MSDLTDESRAVLDEAALDDATPAEVEALRQRVYTTLGVAAPPPAPDVLGPQAAGSSGLVKTMIGGALLVAAVGGTLILRQPEQQTETSAPAAASALAPTPTVPEAVVEAPPPEPAAAAPEPPQRRAEPAVKPPPSAPPSAPSPAAEGAMLVAAAEAQLRAGQPAAALSLYDRYLREYPGGILSQESVTGRILALCALGQKAKGQKELERFETQYPGSPSLRRLRQACGDGP